MDRGLPTPQHFRGGYRPKVCAAWAILQKTATLQTNATCGLLECVWFVVYHPVCRDTSKHNRIPVDGRTLALLKVLLLPIPSRCPRFTEPGLAF